MTDDTDEDRDAIERIDGLDYYGVQLVVGESDIEKGDISICLYKENSTRHVDSTRLYRDDSGEWGCILHDNYAVVDKALSMLNDAAPLAEKRLVADGGTPAEAVGHSIYAPSTIRRDGAVIGTAAVIVVLGVIALA